MEVSEAQAEKLVADVQVAHRLLVAYYQRMLGRLDLIAKELDLDFWYWEPAETERPCSTNTAPSRKWLWDMVPLFASTHFFRKTRGKRPLKGDVVVALSVYADDAFESEKREDAGIRGRPDPLTLPIGRGVLFVEVYRCIGTCRVAWNDAWRKAQDPNYDLHGWQDVGQGFKARAWTCSLVRLMQCPGPLLAMVNDSLQEPLV